MARSLLHHTTPHVGRHCHQPGPGLRAHPISWPCATALECAQGSTSHHVPALLTMPSMMSGKPTHTPQAGYIHRARGQVHQTWGSSAILSALCKQARRFFVPRSLKASSGSASQRPAMLRLRDAMAPSFFPTMTMHKANQHVNFHDFDQVRSSIVS